MLNFALKNPADAVLNEKEFETLSKFVHEQCGIKMPPIKKTMLETRLKKRLKACGANSFSEYCDYLFSKVGMHDELIHMIDVVTTNKTDFFREPAQFTFLSRTALPELIKLYGAGIERKLKVWSAGCSTGEEPYTLSIVLNEFKEIMPGYNFSILASDISTKVLETAMTGIYDMERISVIPMELKKKYFLKGKDTKKNKAKVSADLRKSIIFQRINFMHDDLGIKEKYDIIFCRNVIIYFDKPTQEEVIKKLLKLLLPGGYLFLGHSETIFKTVIPIEQVAPSTYRKL